MRLLFVFIPVFVICNAITLMMLQKGMVRVWNPPPSPPVAAIPEVKAKVEAPLTVLETLPSPTDKTLTHSNKRPEAEPTPTTLEQETHSPAKAELKDPKPKPTLVTPEQPHPSTTKVQVIDGGKQRPGPDATLTTPKQAHPTTTATVTTTAAAAGVHDEDDDRPRKTSKKPGVTRHHETLATHRVYNNTVTPCSNVTSPKARAQYVSIMSKM
ncbi:hypothetical protein PG999_007030 [Apiospora kogelbergensis]|uniref:Uncharacterized protein n=2 Tax=Apiospora kogelbergensis TaxID=1337665 RepID=A0AAW0QX50_9PEZI